MEKQNEMLFIYINAGATVGNNICARSALAVIFDPQYDIIGIWLRAARRGTNWPHRLL